MYYFELFNIPVSLKVDKNIILKKYYQLSKENHPDNFSLSEEKVQTNSLEISSKINEAKKVLENENKRLEYILQHKGIINNEEKQSLAPEFLGEMMNINEKIMELEFDENMDLKNEILSEIKEKETKLFEAVKHFYEMEVLNIFDEDFIRLKEYYYKKKYLSRILERLNGMM